MDAARRYFTDAAQQHGTIDGETLRIPLTQAALARRTGHAPSTVAAHLRSLGDGVLQRSPEIVIAIPCVERRGANPPATAPAVVIIRLEVTVAGGDVVRLVSQPATVDELDARSATVLRDGRGGCRGLRLVDELEEGGGEASSSLLSSPCREGSRDGVASTAAASDVLDDRKITELLSPLHEATRRANLRPMTSRGPLYDALRIYDAAQVRQAVVDLVRDINRLSTDIRSPFGVLVNRARQGLPPAPLPTRESLDDPTTEAEQSEPHRAPSNAQAADQLAALAANQLADLDAYIRLQEGGSLTMPPAMQRAMRLAYVEQWRGMQAHHGDTTRCPREHPENTPRTEGAQP